MSRCALCLKEDHNCAHTQRTASHRKAWAETKIHSLVKCKRPMSFATCVQCVTVQWSTGEQITPDTDTLPALLPSPLLFLWLCVHFFFLSRLSLLHVSHLLRTLKWNIQHLMYTFIAVSHETTPRKEKRAVSLIDITLAESSWSRERWPILTCDALFFSLFFVLCATLTWWHDSSRGEERRGETMTSEGATSSCSCPVYMYINGLEGLSIVVRNEWGRAREWKDRRKSERERREAREMMTKHPQGRKKKRRDETRQDKSYLCSANSRSTDERMPILFVTNGLIFHQPTASFIRQRREGENIENDNHH